MARRCWRHLLRLRLRPRRGRRGGCRLLLLLVVACRGAAPGLLGSSVTICPALPRCACVRRLCLVLAVLCSNVLVAVASAVVTGVKLLVA